MVNNERTDVEGDFERRVLITSHLSQLRGASKDIVIYLPLHTDLIRVSGIVIFRNE